MQEKRKAAMTLTLLSGEQQLVDMTTLHRIETDKAVTRLYFQSGRQMSSLVVRESLNEIKYLAGLFDKLADHKGIAQ